MKRIILLMLAAILCLAGCSNGSGEELNMGALSQKITEYNAQINVLERELEILQEEYDIALSGGECCFVFFIDNIESNLFTQAYPVLKNYGHTGTAVMEDLKVPTMDGCITREQYNVLVAEGWDFAISTGDDLDLSGEDSEAVLREYILQYRQAFKKAGLEMPKTFCFEKGKYSEDYHELLVEEGFQVIRCADGLDEKFSRAVERNGLYLLPVGVLNANNTSQLKKDMATAYQDACTYSIKTDHLYYQVTDKSVDCSVSKYESMLAYVQADCFEANVFNATELYDYKKNVVALESGFTDEQLAEIETKEQEITDIEAKIEEINDMLRES